MVRAPQPIILLVIAAGLALLAGCGQRTADVAPATPSYTVIEPGHEVSFLLDGEPVTIAYADPTTRVVRIRGQELRVACKIQPPTPMKIGDPIQGIHAPASGAPIRVTFTEALRHFSRMEDFRHFLADEGATHHQGWAAGGLLVAIDMEADGSALSVHLWRVRVNGQEPMIPGGMPGLSKAVSRIAARPASL